MMLRICSSVVAKASPGAQHLTLVQYLGWCKPRDVRANHPFNWQIVVSTSDRAAIVNAAVASGGLGLGLVLVREAVVRDRAGQARRAHELPANRGNFEPVGEAL